MTQRSPFVPQSHYDKAALVACGMGELFGPGNAQLPIDNMLMVDRVTHISSEGGVAGKGELIAELDIHPDLWFFGCHFPGDPVMPGCLGLDAMWQLVGFFLDGVAIPAVVALWVPVKSNSLGRFCQATPSCDTTSR